MAGLGGLQQPSPPTTPALWGSTPFLAAFAQNLTELSFVRFRRFQDGQIHEVPPQQLEHYVNEIAVMRLGWLLHHSGVVGRKDRRHGHPEAQFGRARSPFPAAGKKE